MELCMLSCVISLTERRRVKQRRILEDAISRVRRVRVPSGAPIGTQINPNTNANALPIREPFDGRVKT